MNLIIAVASAFGAVLAAGVFTAFEPRRGAEVGGALRKLDEYKIETAGEQPLRPPATDRLIKPIIERISKLTGRFPPAGYTDQVRHKLEIAGNVGGLDV